MRPLGAVVAALVVAASLTACNGDGAGEGEGSGREPRSTPYEHPTGADDVVLRIDSGGSLESYDAAFVTSGPRLVVTGDGRVLRPATDRPSDPEGDPPFLVPYEVGRVDESVLQALLGAADEAGLLAEPPEYEEPQITDATGTAVVVAADGEERRHYAYALGFQDESGARARLESFVADVEEIVPAAGELEVTPYVPERLRIVASGVAVAPGSPEPPAWNGPDLTTSECQVVPVDDLPPELLEPGSDGVVSRQGETFQLVAAVVVPGDPSDPCEKW